MRRQLTRVCQSMLIVLAVCVSSHSDAASRGTPGRASFGAAWKTVNCHTFDVPDAIAAQSDCGYVTVPEQHAFPKGPTIQLAVVRTRSESAAPASDPIFVEQGGPGDTTIGVFANMALPLKSPGLIALLKNRDLIFMEERGTRYSKPFLSCPEVNAHNVDVAKGIKKSEDPDWIKACDDRFKSQGINPSAFNTRENAADLYFVAETLGYKEFNFYGGSYGTLLGQYAISQADKHTAKLRSAILDGVVRPDIDFNLAFSYTISHSLRNVFHDCAQDLQCSQAYPDLEQKFLGIIDRLNKNPLPVTLTVPSSKEVITTKLDGMTFIDGILMYLYVTSEEDRVPKLIHAASEGDFSWINQPLSEGLESSNAKEMYHTVLCARVKSLNVSPSQVLPAAYPILMQIGQRESDNVRNACDVLNVALKPPFVYENTDIPVLIFNGAYDPATPQPYGEAVAKNFKTSYVYTFPSVGHVALILKPSVPAARCSAQIAADFVNDPKKKPDSSCITQIKPAFLLK